jgi:hypothetical protein
MVYKDSGWLGWGDFLGTGNLARHLIKYRPFHEARAFARSLGLANVAAWRAVCSKRMGNRRVLPADIPTMPNRVYAGKGWTSHGDWLGTNHVHSSKIRYRNYAEAQAFVRKLRIRTEPEWRAYCRGEIPHLVRRPADIPSNPSRHYHGRGWKTWGHFFGTGAVANYYRVYRPYKAARTYARTLRLRSGLEWRAWCRAGRKPSDIPSDVESSYVDRGWAGWKDFLGNGGRHRGRAKGDYRSFTEARAHVRKLRLSTAKEFYRTKRSGGIPRDIPLTVYRYPAWKGWADFLGPSYSGNSLSNF